VAVASGLGFRRVLVCALLGLTGASPTGSWASEVADLPITEVRAPEGASPQFALLLTGDGGWAAFAHGVSARLAQSGISVVGLSSLKYFWRPRTPEGAAADVGRVLRHYLAAWNKGQVMLIGYSFGADVLPSIVNRLPADLRATIASISLIGLAHDVTWEVRVTDWLPGLAPTGTLISPEIERLPPIPLLCLFGADEKSLCPELRPDRATVVSIGKGHHLDGEYTAIADRILEFARSNGLP
jgi:type IV secretory pathway VirJ component